MEKILITGVNGFIGSNLAHYLLKNNYIIFGTVRPTSNISLIENIPINLIITDYKYFNQDTEIYDFDYIIHCASSVSDFLNSKNAKKGIFDLTKILYDKIVLKQKHLKKFIYISTSLVLGYKRLNISERNPGIPLKNNYYVYYKKKSEEYIIENCQKNQIIYTILRPADVYGPRDRTSCFHILKAIEKGIPVIVGKGNSIFPFCSSKVLCEAVYSSLTKEVSDNKIYTITSGLEINWKQFFEFFQNKFNKPQKIYIPPFFAKLIGRISLIIHKIVPIFKPSLTPYRITRITTNTSYDISDSIRDLNISTGYDYKEDLEDIYKWYIQIKDKAE